MILPTDIPTRAEVDRLLEHRAPWSVSIYLPTDPASNGDPERIELKTLVAQASSQLRQVGAGVRVIRQFEDEIGYLQYDEGFWRYQARSLATFVARNRLVTFRLPNRLLSQVEVSDRFHLRPLLRTLTFPHIAFLLALAQGSVRVVEVTPDLDPARIDVDDLPSDVAGAVGKSSIADRAPTRRIQGSEGQKVRMRQYAREVDRALRPLLNGLEVPLILAATDPIDSIYRSVSTYPHLLAQGSPEAQKLSLIESLPPEPARSLTTSTRRSCVTSRSSTDNVPRTGVLSPTSPKSHVRRASARSRRCWWTSMPPFRARSTMRLVRSRLPPSPAAMFTT